MKLEEIEEYLNKRYKNVNLSEDTDEEQLFYNNNITKLRRAIKSG